MKALSEFYFWARQTPNSSSIVMSPHLLHLMVKFLSTKGLPQSYCHYQVISSPHSLWHLSHFMLNPFFDWEVGQALTSASISMLQVQSHIAIHFPFKPYASPSMHYLALHFLCFRQSAIKFWAPSKSRNFEHLGHQVLYHPLWLFLGLERSNWRNV